MLQLLHAPKVGTLTTTDIANICLIQSCFIILEFRFLEYALRLLSDNLDIEKKQILLCGAKPPITFHTNSLKAHNRTGFVSEDLTLKCPLNEIKIQFRHTRIQRLG